MKVLQINSTITNGSVGRIVEDLGEFFFSNGFESYIAYGSGNSKGNNSILIRVSTFSGFVTHLFSSFFLDRHGFSSKLDTFKLIHNIKLINPDVIILHNLHGYYLNINLLFKYLSKSNVPILWVFHDCWPITGHCTYFDSHNCIKWKTECNNCPKSKYYPKSFFIDNSQKNFNQKKGLFTSIPNLYIITPSNWLKNIVNASFFKCKVVTINNGIDLSKFNSLKNLQSSQNTGVQKKIILGCASIWGERKGLADFFELSKILPDDYQIVLIGLSKKQINTLPKKIAGFPKLNTISELSHWYSKAFVFVNPTYQDNFPTTNLEALACGTPVITYQTGGSAESIDYNTGFMLQKGDINGILESCLTLEKMDYSYISKQCRYRAEQLYDNKKVYQQYLELIKNIYSFIQ